MKQERGVEMNNENNLTSEILDIVESRGGAF